MKVKELIKVLENLDENLEIRIAEAQTSTQFTSMKLANITTSIESTSIYLWGGGKSEDAIRSWKLNEIKK